MNQVTEQKQTPPANETHRREAGADAVLQPAADIFEHDQGITVLMDMAGVSKDRLNIESDRNTLLVEGDVELTMPEDTESLYADIRCTRYRRSFSLSGEQLDTQAVKATLKDGVLRIDIPKRQEMRPRKIEVQAG